MANEIIPNGPVIGDYFANYAQWRVRRADFRASRRRSNTRLNPLLFSVFVRAGERASPDAFAATIESIRAQDYRNIEIFVDHGEAALPTGFEALKAECRSLRGLSLARGMTPPDILNEAETDTLWRGDYAAFFAAGVVFDRDAFTTIFEALATRARALPEVALCDWDMIGASGAFEDPCFMPGWDPDLHECFDYIGDSVFLSREAIHAARAEGPNRSTRDWLARRLASPRRGQVLHVAEPVIHAPRRESGAAVKDGERPVAFAAPATKPRAAFVIPSKDRPGLLEACLKFLDFDNDFEPELVFVDNNSSDPRTLAIYDEQKRRRGAKVVAMNQTFNFARTSPLLVLLNNDIEFRRPGQIEKLIARASRDDAGVVGSLLLNADGTIQHSGIVLSPLIYAAHVGRRARGDAPGYLGASGLPRNWQAVTGALLATRADVFARFGGFDEVMLPVEFNDIDYCLKTRAAGLRAVCLPLEGVYHNESSTRGTQPSPMVERMRSSAIACMRARWPEEFAADPFHNPRLRLGEFIRVELMEPAA